MSNFSFIHSSNIQGSSFILDEKESHHIISVLRLREGSNITLTDGKGNIYHAKIELISKKTVEGKILSIEKSSRNNKKKNKEMNLGTDLSGWLAGWPLAGRRGKGEYGVGRV